jgi:hypothetical protein
MIAAFKVAAWAGSVCNVLMLPHLAQSAEIRRVHYQQRFNLNCEGNAGCRTNTAQVSSKQQLEIRFIHCEINVSPTVKLAGMRVIEQSTGAVISLRLDEEAPFPNGITHRAYNIETDLLVPAGGYLTLDVTAGFTNQTFRAGNCSLMGDRVILQ